MLDDQYLSGFGCEFSTEAISGALPADQYNPQKVPFGLYAEQLSGDAFTQPRKDNRRLWLYRLQPSVVQGEATIYQQHLLQTPPFDFITPPTQLRWQPLAYPERHVDFIDSLVTFAGHGCAAMRQGGAIHLYAATASMVDRYFYNTDGDLLIVPQSGSLRIKTECGELQVVPGEIAVIVRGIKFQVELLAEAARGYVLENFAAPFELPNLGPIGPNALAQARHFLTPKAQYEEKRGDFQLLAKYQGHLWQIPIDHSPLDVVAWTGNYVPYKYDLKRFTAINTVSFDHTDPSIFTVLSSATNTPGLANIDFVIFPTRWMVAEHTMRLPYYHRNSMSEYMGLIYGAYDAKVANKSGFVPGGGSLHNCMAPHGPDAQSYEAAIKVELKPDYYEKTLAFMFESYFAWQVTEYAYEATCRDKAYVNCWQNLGVTFKP